MHLSTTFFNGVCTWMKTKRNGIVHRKRRSSVTSTSTAVTVKVEAEVAESREYEAYDLNLPASYEANTDDNDALDDSLSTLVLPSSTSTLHKRRVEEALLEYERLRIQSTLQLHQLPTYW